MYSAFCDLATDGNCLRVYGMNANGTPALPLIATLTLGTSSIQALAVGDVNRDGRDDLVGIDQNNAVQVFVQGATIGSFSLVSGGGIFNNFSPDSLQIGDIDLDGHVDLAAQYSAANHSAIELMMWTSGTFTVTPGMVESFGRNTTDVRLLDLSGRGRPSLVGLTSTYDGNGQPLWGVSIKR